MTDCFSITGEGLGEAAGGFCDTTGEGDGDGDGFVEGTAGVTKDGEGFEDGVIDGDGTTDGLADGLTISGGDGVMDGLPDGIGIYVGDGDFETIGGILGELEIPEEETGVHDAVKRIRIVEIAIIARWTLLKFTFTHLP